MLLSDLHVDVCTQKKPILSGFNTLLIRLLGYSERHFHNYFFKLLDARTHFVNNSRKGLLVHYLRWRQTEWYLIVNVSGKCRGERPVGVIISVPGLRLWRVSVPNEFGCCAFIWVLTVPIRWQWALACIRVD